MDYIVWGVFLHIFTLFSYLQGSSPEETSLGAHSPHS